MLPKPIRKYTQGQADHIDAWLISYADLITLLFTLFVIFVSVTVTKYGHSTTVRSEPEYYLEKHSGLMALGTRYDELYRSVGAVIVNNAADQQIAVEKSTRGLAIDISATQFFERGSASILPGKLALLHDIVQTIKNETHDDDVIEVESYTDDTPFQEGPFADNWELTAMRSSHIVKLLIGEGIAPSRLHALSFADNKPLVPNRDAQGSPIPENRDRNQRVVIRVESAFTK